MAWFRSLRRKGSRPSRSAAPSDSRVTRDIIGPTGWLSSNAWQQLDDNGEAYKQSFDRRLPPSLFVSERDRLRANQPMPLVERCIEDYRGMQPTPVAAVQVTERDSEQDSSKPDAAGPDGPDDDGGGVVPSVDPTVDPTVE